MKVVVFQNASRHITEKGFVCKYTLVA